MLLNDYPRTYRVSLNDITLIGIDISTGDYVDRGVKTKKACTYKAS
jgi:hypothetical protein